MSIRVPKDSLRDQLVLAAYDKIAQAILAEMAASVFQSQRYRKPGPIARLRRWLGARL